MAYYERGSEIFEGNEPKIRRLIEAHVLPAVQVVLGAPYQIRADDLASPAVKAAVARKGRPCRVDDANTLSMFPDA